MDLLTAGELSAGDIGSLIDEAIFLKANPRTHATALEGKSLAMHVAHAEKVRLRFIRAECELRRSAGKGVEIDNRSVFV